MRVRIIPALALLSLAAGSAFGQTTGFTLSNSPNPSTFGQAVTLTASPAPPSVPVTFYDGGSSGTPIGSGTTTSANGGAVSIQVTNLLPGSHLLVACYPVSSDFGPSRVCSNTVTQQVNPIPTSLQLTSSQNPSAPCVAVTFTATLSQSAATGTIAFFDGTTPLGSATVSGGSASVTVSSFTLGNHNILAQYTPDATSGYGPSQNTMRQVVNGSATVTLSSTPNPSNISQPVTISAAVTPLACAGTPPPSTSPTGTVTFFDGTTQIGQSGIISGTATTSTSTLGVGNHPLSAVYSGDSNFGSATSNTVTQVVNPGKTNTTTTLSTSANPITTAQPLTLTASVTPSGATGQVQFKDGGTVIGTSTLSGGTASLTLPSLTAGAHPLSAVYLGDNNFNTSTSNTVNETVNAATTNTTTTLSTSANPITTAQALTLTAVVVPSGATGQVQFRDGGTVVGTSTLSGGTASLTLNSLTAGVHPLTAVYLGDTNFNTSTSNTVNETVNPPAKTNTTTNLTAAPNPVNTGQPLTLTASVTPSSATGTVQFTDGGNPLGGPVTLNNGIASITTSTPTQTAGTHSLAAIYSGDANFNPSTGAFNVSVTQPTNQPTTTSLSVSPNPANLGQAVVMSAVVTPSTATGTVTFTDNGTILGTGTLANGAASFSTSSLAAGSHTIVAVYGGNSTFNSSSSNPVTLVVGKTNTTTSLSASSNPATSGQPLTLTAGVLPAGATGQVQFTDGGTLLGTVTLANGFASFTTSTLTTGNHSLSASYSGDANFNPSTSPTVNLVVNSATNQPTSTSLSVAPSPASPGQLVVMTARVTPSTATGTVTFSDNGSTLGAVQLSGGVASFSTSSLAAGSHLIVAVYGGSTTFSPSTSSPVALVVNTTFTAPGTQTTISSSPNPSNFGQAVTLFASVTPVNLSSGVPTGTITFSDGTTTLATTTLTNGAASFSTTTLSVGTHSLSAFYSGDGTFNASTSLPVNQVVNKATTTTSLTASPTSITPGQGVLLTAKVTPSTATGTVTFSDGTITIGPVPVVAGSASTTTSSLVAPGNHALTATYSGDANFLASSSTAVTVTVGAGGPTPTTTTLSVSPTTSAVGQAVSLNATVAPAGATGTVTFMDGSTALGSQSLSSGSATLSTSSLTAGTHSLSAVYSGDTKFATSSSPAVTETVTGKNNSTTALSVSPNPGPTGQPVTLTATVAPASATGTVTFLDGGNLLGPGTLSGGSATFTTSSLSTGSHSLTASYAGDTNTNGSTSAAVTEIINGTALGSISPTALPTAIVGVAYSQTFTVTGGTPPLTWTLASGSVPGLTLSSGGILSGTPTTAGTTSLTVRVQDSASPAAAAAAVLSLTVLPLPSPSISSPTVSSTSDQPAPQVTLSPAFTVALTATFTLSFTPNASNLPANYVNPDVKFIGGSTTSAPVTIPANSTSPVTLPAIQVGTVAGTITVKLVTLTTSTGQSVLPANPVTASITLGRLAPVIVPGSVKITNITSTGFSVVLDGSSTPRDLTSASLTFTAASGTQLNGATETVSLSTAATTWFTSTPGVTNGGAFSVTMPFAYSGDPTAIGTVSVTLTNSVGTSAAVSGGR